MLLNIVGPVQALHASLDPEQLLQVANGAVVGLVAGEPEAALQQQPCLGLGILRAVDPQRGLLYLLTPLPAEQLQQVQPDATIPTGLCLCAGTHSVCALAGRRRCIAGPAANASSRAGQQLLPLRSRLHTSMQLLTTQACKQSVVWCR